ncbi:MAG: glycosyl transferase [Lachnospiraceae bacterium]|nr:glycosyl transferase [Lachnospiraceae bacterium]
MSKFTFLKELLTDPGTRFYFLSAHGFYHGMSDEKYIKRLWKYRMGDQVLDLDDPKTLCEKLQWLKIYDHNPEYTKFADKYEVKKIVSETIGKEHVVPLLGVWDDFDDIDFSKLPDQFILKTTHDSGGFMICKDKSTFDVNAARKKFKKAVKRNFYWSGREWQYKNIPPRIIAEKYIDSLGKPDSFEYKLTCMNGEVKFTTVCRGIAHAGFKDRTNDHFDRNGQKMPWYVFYEPSKTPVELPPQIDELIEYSEKLAKGIPYVRVDYYIVDGTVYFGEMTFNTWDGFMEFTPHEWDRKLGDMLVLPDEKRS